MPAGTFKQCGPLSWTTSSPGSIACTVERKYNGEKLRLHGATKVLNLKLGDGLSLHVYGTSHGGCKTW